MTTLKVAEIMEVTNQEIAETMREALENGRVPLHEQILVEGYIAQYEELERANLAG